MWRATHPRDSGANNRQNGAGPRSRHLRDVVCEPATEGLHCVGFERESLFEVGSEGTPETRGHGYRALNRTAC